MSLDLVREIETLALHAWPARLQVACDGWVLRENAGMTGRANSVWPNADDGELTLQEKIARAEAFYREHGLPAMFQISPAACPPELEAALQARGYIAQKPTLVQVAEVERVLACAAAPGQVLTEDHPNGGWFETYAEVGGFSAGEAEARRDVVRRIGRPVYASIDAEERLAAVGLGVLTDGWLGLFCMATRPDARRRGYATAIVSGLTEWARKRRAERLYLQVEEDNAGARALYETLGFRTAYAYLYRTYQGRSDG